jgi:hypothetical protein
MSQRLEASCSEPAQCTVRTESLPAGNGCVSGQKKGGFEWSKVRTRSDRIRRSAVKERRGQSQRLRASGREPAQCTVRTESFPAGDACMSGQRKGVFKLRNVVTHYKSVRKECKLGAELQTMGNAR